jgi:hypothetical protein
MSILPWLSWPVARAAQEWGNRILTKYHRAFLLSFFFFFCFFFFFFFFFFWENAISIFGQRSSGYQFMAKSVEVAVFSSAGHNELLYVNVSCVRFYP